MSRVRVTGYGEQILYLENVDIGSTWAISAQDALLLRAELGAALALPMMTIAGGEMRPSLGCRITRGRKACRSCMAEVGHAHAPTCPEVLQPAEQAFLPELERRQGERRSRMFSGADLATDWAEQFPPRGPNFPCVVIGVDYGAVDPPTPEEKAAGERPAT